MTRRRNWNAACATSTPYRWNVPIPGVSSATRGIFCIPRTLKRQASRTEAGCKTAGRRKAAQPPPAARDPRTADRHFGGSRVRGDQSLRHRDERAHRAGPRLRPQGSFARRAARLGLPAPSSPGGGDRRRPLLGRRLHGESRDLAADLQLLHRGRGARSDQSAGARRGAAHPRRDREPPERDRLQFIADTCASTWSATRGA